MAPIIKSMKKSEKETTYLTGGRDILEKIGMSEKFRIVKVLEDKLWIEN